MTSPEARVSLVTSVPGLDLAALVAPLGVEQFLRDHWPSRPYFSPDGPGRLAALAAITELDAVETTITTSKRVSFFTPDGRSVEAEHPLKLYAVGLTCYMSCSHVAGLVEIAERLASDLGIASGSLNCEAFCSVDDSRVTMHSDRDLNFAILVRGHKRWRIAENRNIRNQTSLCRPSSAPTHDPFQLTLADALPFPEAMPEDAMEIDVDPGGLLFLPRGWWHETEASGECFQVNFVMNRPMWFEVLTRALKERLIRDVRWRAMAHDIFGAPERRDIALAELGDLVATLCKELGGLDPNTLAAGLIADAGLHAVDGA